MAGARREGSEAAARAAFEIGQRPAALLAIAILGLVAAVYSAGIGSFFSVDDFPWITHTLKLYRDPLAALAERWTWSGSCVLFALEVALFGTRPIGYDVANLLLHLANTALVGLLALRLGRNRVAALAAMLLFGTLAAVSEAVLHKTSQGHTLLLLLMLATVLLFQRFLESGGARRLLAALAAAAATHLTLFSAVVLPALLAALRWLWRRPGERWRRLALPLVPFAAVSGIYLVVYTQLATTVAPSGYLRPGWQLVPRFGAYLVQLFSLVPDLLPRSLGTGWLAATVGWLGLAAFLAALALLRSPAARFALAWTGLVLLPYLAVPFEGGFQPPRYRYAPAVGVCLLAGLVLAAGIERAASARRLRWLGLGSLALLVAVLVGVNARLVRERARDFEDIGEAYRGLVTATEPIASRLTAGRLLVVDDRSLVNTPALLAPRLRQPLGLYVRVTAPWRLVDPEDLLTFVAQERRPGTLCLLVEPDAARAELGAGSADVIRVDDNGLRLVPASAQELLALAPRLSSREGRTSVTALRCLAPDRQ